MSEKEKFIAAQQAEAQRQAQARDNEKAALATFQDALATLAKQLKQWTEGTNIEIESRPIEIHDDTIKQRYQATQTTLSFNGKKVTFRPWALYLIGAMGGVKIDGLKYELTLSRARGGEPGWAWAYRHPNQPRTLPLTEQILNEDTFFSLLNDAR